jgi:hypothetical protein
MNKLELHDKIQEELAGPEAYEVKVERRLRNLLTSKPGLSAADLKNKMPFVLETIFDLVLGRLVREGKVEARPVKHNYYLKG